MKIWTGADLYRLRTLAESKTVAETAAELDRSPTAVRQKAFELGITFVRGRFFSASDVARGLGVSRAAVTNWVTKLGLLKGKSRAKGRNLPLTDEDVVKLCFAILEGRLESNGRAANTTTARVRAYRDWLLGETERAEPGFRPRRGQKRCR